MDLKHHLAPALIAALARAGRNACRPTPAALLLAIAMLLPASTAQAIAFPETPAARAEAERLALAGDAGAAFQLGLWHRAQSLLAPSETARVAAIEPMVRWLRMAAEAGHVEAMYEMSKIRTHGNSDPVRERGMALVSAEEGLQWRMRASEQGHLSARYVLAMGYMSGAAPQQQDQREGVRLLTLNAEAGDGLSMRELGEAYRNGRGVAKDDAMALRWLQRAYDTGEYGVEGALAVLLHRGVPGTPADQTRALAVIRRGVERNDVSSLLSLAAYHENGWGGLAPSYPEALALYRRAAARAITDQQKTDAAQRIASVEAAMAAGRVAGTPAPRPSPGAAETPAATSAAPATSAARAPAAAAAQPSLIVLDCSISGQLVDTNGFGEQEYRNETFEGTLEVEGGEAYLDVSSSRFSRSFELDRTQTRYEGSSAGRTRNGAEITFDVSINRSSGEVRMTGMMTRQPTTIRGAWDFEYEGSGYCTEQEAPRF